MQFSLCYCGFFALIFFDCHGNFTESRLNFNLIVRVDFVAATKKDYLILFRQSFPTDLYATYLKFRG